MSAAQGESARPPLLVLGIGNLLMGDEGIGVHVVRRLAEAPLPAGVECLDGGTGGLHLLDPLLSADRVVLVDAIADGAPVGTLRRLRPRYSADYPPTLAAHDIGLKDLLDALALLGQEPDVTLFAVSIEWPGAMRAEPSPALTARLPAIVDRVRAEIALRLGAASAVRRHLACRGAVQGVGFRPAVVRLARSLGLGGWVRNDPDGAAIEVEGPPEAVGRFEQALLGALPPLARLEAVEARDTTPRGERSFGVGPSTGGARRSALIPPDAALCRACRDELSDPLDRRHRHPFVTCTDCGPRYSLARSLPYDRERTSMACFALCAACRAEYEDPGGRRFHAEPVCCPACGPRLWLADARGETRARDQRALALARQALAAGAIVAVKGIGGFQLACRADDATTLKRLRERKRRPTRPFAVMAPDLESARALASLRAEDERLLLSTESPILLAPRAEPCELPEELAPGLSEIGVLLPTTALHAELFRDAPYRALVMTSGNASDEPICRGNREALARLAGIADLFLLHDRDVVRRLDDSVVRVGEDGHASVRRSRGFVPRPVPLPVHVPEPVLALGGHLQATACVAVGAQLFPSQHVGDLDTDEARTFLEEEAAGLERFLEVEARVLVADLHPDYPSAWLAERLARERGGRVLRFQHHLAHAAAVLAEHSAFPERGERVAALVLDGTGWGSDGTAWGCEWLLLDGELRWRRLAHAEPLPLVGGERAVREPWRVAVAALAAAGAMDQIAALPLAERVPAQRIEQVARLATRGRWPLAGGAGRLFEAAGALLGLCVENGWEGEAAARLESLASGASREPAPWPELGRAGPRPVLAGAALLAAAARRAASGERPEDVAAGFHASFARLVAETTQRAVPRDVRKLALGGGCLVNRILRRRLREELTSRGFRALLPSELPPGDGGLSSGQATLAAVALTRGVVPREGDE